MRDSKISAPWDVRLNYQGLMASTKEGNKDLIEKIEEFYKSLPDLKHEGHRPDRGCPKCVRE